jgi:hypothetical protein
MSTLATNAITDASGGNTTTINGLTPTVSNMAGRNRIINGDMRIDARNAGASASFGSYGYVLDRWNQAKNSGSAGTIQQSSTAPVGFKNSMLVTNNATGVTPASGDSNRIQTRIEGNNIADLEFGTADAKTITLSFWVRSSLTGTYGVGFNNSAFDRSYVATYTISSADTWEQKTITLTGDTTGTWLDDNGSGIAVTFDLGSGSDNEGTASVWQAGTKYRTSGCVNWVGTSGATFYVTGVQLEAGSVATPFEHRLYGQELALCQRYYETGYATAGSRSGDNIAVMCSFFATNKRATPTMTFTSIQGGGVNLSGSYLNASEFFNNPGASSNGRATWFASAEL